MILWNFSDKLRVFRFCVKHIAGISDIRNKEQPYVLRKLPSFGVNSDWAIMRPMINSRQLCVAFVGFPEPASRKAC